MKALSATTSPRSGHVESFLRALPFPLTRALIVADLAHGGLNPLWGWWLYRRWTGKRITWRTYWPIYKRSLDFAWKYFRNRQSHTGLFSIAWRSSPVRHTFFEERIDYQPKGSCGTCTNCCKTHWLPSTQQVACPFLVNQECTIYAGLYWDYFNCGRYPTSEANVRLYECPRFTRNRNIIPDS